MATPHRKAFVSAFLILAAAHLCLMAAPRLYPFIDLPGHLAAATIVREGGEASNEFDAYFTVRAFPAPNVFHLLFCGSRVFPTAEAGNRFLYSIYAVLLPLSVLLFIRRLGGNEWYALLSFIFVPNYSVMWGFAGFTVAIPFVLLFALVLFAHDDRPSARTRWGLASFLVLIFTMHALAALFTLLIYLLHLAWRHRAVSASSLGDAALALPVLILFAGWWATRIPGDFPSIAGYICGYYAGEYARSLRSRGMLLFLDNYHLYGGAKGYVVAAGFALAAIVPVVSRLGTHVRNFRDSLASRRQGPIYALVLASFLGCLILPEGIPGQWSVWMRYTVFACLSLVILASTVRWRRLTAVKAAAIAGVCLVHVAIWSGYVTDFQRENRSFDTSLFPEPTTGSILSGLMLDADYRGAPTYMHFQNYYIVWKQGIATTSIVDYQFGSVRRRVGESVLPNNDICDVLDGVPSQKYQRADYILARGNVSDEPLPGLDGFRPVRAQGQWSLLARDAGRPPSGVIPRHETAGTP